MKFPWFSGSFCYKIVSWLTRTICALAVSKRDRNMKQKTTTMDENEDSWDNNLFWVFQMRYRFSMNCWTDHVFVFEFCNQLVRLNLKWKWVRKNYFWWLLWCTWIVQLNNCIVKHLVFPNWIEIHIYLAAC